MCIQFFKDLFKKPEIPNYERAEKVLLSFAINDYIGSDNDLQGCINDQGNVSKNLYEYQKRLFIDSLVKRQIMMDAWEKAFTEAIPGDQITIHYSGHGTQVRDRNSEELDGYDEALYLYDGTLIDDDIHGLLQLIPENVSVLLLIDSCFSGTITRNSPDMPKKPRFVQTESKIYKDLIVPFAYPKVEEVGVNPWIVISGSGENQTSADAYIDNLWQGAFTFYAMKTLDRRYTYRQWYNTLRLYLPNNYFDQAPTIEGPEYMLNKLVLT